VAADSQIKTFAPARGVRARARQQADQLHSMIARDIDQGVIKPGEHIATERELAEQFGASRSVVRTALAELHKAGKIVRKVGYGTIVQGPTDDSPKAEGLPLLDTSPVELLEFRLALEPGLAESITRNASERDMLAILDCVEHGDHATGWEEWERWDRAFHMSLVAATHNRLTIGVYEAIIGIRHEQPWLKAKQSHTNAIHWQHYQDEHRRIAASLINRDAVAAQQAIYDHLAKVRTKMLGA
jgi:GntR family uxuAB operon transcriptional repressor